MEKEYMVYTDKGDFPITAKSAEAAARRIYLDNFCRARIISVQRV